MSTRENLRLIARVSFILLFVMPISEIFNGNGFRFNFLMVRFFKVVQIVNSHYLPKDLGQS